MGVEAVEVAVRLCQGLLHPVAQGAVERHALMRLIVPLMLTHLVRIPLEPLARLVRLGLVVPGLSVVQVETLSLMLHLH